MCEREGLEVKNKELGMVEETKYKKKGRLCSLFSNLAIKILVFREALTSNF